MKKGFSVVEVLLAVVILSLFVMATVGAVLYGEESSALSGARNRAALVAAEGIEADRNIRDANYANLLTGTYGLTTTGNSWHLSGSQDLIGLYTRTQIIATASGSDDERDVTSSAVWQQNLQRPGAVSIYTRFTNWARKFGNWSSVSQQCSLNLPGNQAGNKVAVQGNYAYMVRQGGIPDFAVVDVAASPCPVLVGQLTLSGTPTNIFVQGNYAYVSSTNNTGELQIVDISNPSSPVQVGFDDPTGNSDGNGVWVVGTTAIMTRAGSVNNFVVINVANPSSPTQTAILSLNGPLYEVFVMGNYAYVSSGDNNSELQIVNISNLSSPVLTGAINLAGNADAVTITGYRGPDTVFLGQNDGTFSIVDVTNPAAPVFLSSFAAGVSVNDIALAVSDGYAMLATAHSTEEFQILDISNLSSPTLLGLVNLGNALNGVTYDTQRDRSYVVGTNNSAEFIVIKPQ